MRIQVIDDDVALAEMISIVLRDQGFDVDVSHNGRAAVDDFDDWNPDLVLLDLMLPGLGGIAVCERLKAKSDVPIIMLTAKTDTQDVVAGLEAGADDYISKPFKPAELVARVRARLRSLTPQEAVRLYVADLVIDVEAHEVKRAGKPLLVTPLEFRILTTLAAAPAHAFTRDELLDQVWGYSYKADTRLVNVHIQRLRAKVEIDPENPKVVETVRGVGYRAGAVTS